MVLGDLPVLSKYLINFITGSISWYSLSSNKYNGYYSPLLSFEPSHVPTSLNT